MIPAMSAGAVSDINIYFFSRLRGSRRPLEEKLGAVLGDAGGVVGSACAKTCGHIDLEVYAGDPERFVPTLRAVLAAHGAPAGTKIQVGGKTYDL
jgi:hypothetical protein